jgi:hypothetical protein
VDGSERHLYGPLVARTLLWWTLGVGLGSAALLWLAGSLPGGDGRAQDACRSLCTAVIIAVGVVVLLIGIVAGLLMISPSVD